MFRKVVVSRCMPRVQVRGYLTSSPSISSGDVQLESRPKKKIRVGKARPAIYHKFNTLVELSDGSVIVRRTQYPKAEVRMINDQRNNPLWNPSRSDLSQVNERAAGRLSKFKQRYALFKDLDSTGGSESQKTDSSNEETQKKEAKKQTEDAFGLDDYLELVGENAQEVQSGGRLAVKRKSKK